MKRTLRFSLIAAAAAFIALPGAASAQSRCSAGQAANGGCVNEAMAMAAIQAAVIYSQPKISLTAYPVLPSADRIYRYPNQLIPKSAGTNTYCAASAAVFWRVTADRPHCLVRQFNTAKRRGKKKPRRFVI